MSYTLDQALGRWFADTPDAAQSLATGGWLDTQQRGPAFQFLAQADAQAAAAAYLTENPGSPALVVSFAVVPDGTAMSSLAASMTLTSRSLHDAIAALTQRVAALESASSAGTSTTTTPTATTSTTSTTGATK